VELEIAHSYGWLQANVTLELSLDELQRLHAAIIAAQPHAANPIFDDLLELIEDHL
jgi:hypothetical protein